MGDYVDNRSTAEVAKDTRISEHTVRATYSALRDRLITAAMDDPSRFGGAGRFLFDERSLGDRGKRFMGEVAKTDLFESHIRRHAPKAKAEERYGELLFECSVRVFCTLSMRDDPEAFYPDDTREAVKTFHEIAKWIADNRHMEGFTEKHASTIKRFETVMLSMPRLLEKEDLVALKIHSAEHRFPNDILYNDLRRYLLNDPL